jgi:hypothetical protein
LLAIFWAVGNEILPTAFFERNYRSFIMSKITLIAVAFVFALSISGCGKKADENKPISEVKAEAAKMNVEQLRQMATSYKTALASKQAEVDKLVTKLKEIPVTQILGEESKKLKGDIDNLTKSTSALQERFGIYYNALKEKGGNLAGLEVK